MGDTQKDEKDRTWEGGKRVGGIIWPQESGQYSLYLTIPYIFHAVNRYTILSVQTTKNVTLYQIKVAYELSRLGQIVFVLLLLRNGLAFLCWLTIGLLCTQRKLASLSHIHSNTPLPTYPFLSPAYLSWYTYWAKKNCSYASNKRLRNVLFLLWTFLTV